MLAVPNNCKTRATWRLSQEDDILQASFIIYNKVKDAMMAVLKLE
jgi:hypothetical protein